MALTCTGPPGRVAGIVASAAAKDGRSDSFENLQLRVKRRCNIESRNAYPRQIRVQEGMHAVRRNSKLATSIDTEHTKRTEPPPRDTALQQGAVIAEGKVVRATDCYA